MEKRQQREQKHRGVSGQCVLGKTCGDDADRFPGTREAGLRRLDENPGSTLVSSLSKGRFGTWERCEQNCQHGEGFRESQARGEGSSCRTRAEDSLDPPPR